MDMMKENNCLMWSIRNGEVYKKCPQVYELQNTIDELQAEVEKLKAIAEYACHKKDCNPKPWENKCKCGYLHVLKEK